MKKNILSKKSKIYSGISIVPMAMTVAILAGWMIARAAPEAEPWPEWNKDDPSSTTSVDHSSWGRFLQVYLVTDDPAGVNLVRYSKVTPGDRKLIEDYLDQLQKVEVTGLNRAEQKAYWINLYNTLTVKVVLDHYPVKSIRDINLSSGLLGRFTGGPWKAKSIKVEGEELSLDDIEHRILRPIWRDPRVHYAVNCASLGCPNLQPKPFTADSVDSLLDRAAREYVNHPRAAQVVSSGRIILSSIYDWFQQDFGGSEKAVLQHLRRYAEPSLARKLENFHGKIDYQYDWTLNDRK